MSGRGRLSIESSVGIAWIASGSLAFAAFDVSACCSPALYPKRNQSSQILNRFHHRLSMNASKFTAGEVGSDCDLTRFAMLFIPGPGCTTTLPGQRLTVVD